MAWARLDDGFSDHPKVLNLIDTLPELEGAAAIGLWTLALSYAHRTMRNAKIPGLIPRSFARRNLVPTWLGDRLVAAGLWEDHEDGWLIHDFADYLPSEDLRSKRAEAGKRGAAARWGKSAGQASAEPKSPGSDSNLPDFANDKNGNSCPEPEPEPEPKKKTSSSSSARKPAATARGTRIPDNFALTDEMRTWGQDAYPWINGDLETEKFVNYWRAKTGAGATKLDWPATWRNWIHTAAERANGGGLTTRASPVARRATTDVRMEQADQALAELLADRANGIPVFGYSAANPNNQAAIDIGPVFREIEP